TLHVARRLVVRGELARDLAAAAAEGVLLAQRDPLVRPHATRFRHARVQRLLVERVQEAVAAGHRAVGPLLDAVPTYHASAPGERLAALLDRVGLLVERRGDRRDAEVDARDARRLDHAPIFLVERFDLAVDHAAQALGQTGRKLLDAVAEDDLTVLLADHALAQQVVEDVDHEERVALGARVQET